MADPQFIPDVPQATFIPDQASAAQTQFIPDKPQGRGILQALLDYPAHFAQGLVDTAKYPGEVLKSETPTTSEGLVDSGQPIGLALMGGLKLSPKVGGVRARPADVMSEGPTV